MQSCVDIVCFGSTSLHSFKTSLHILVVYNVRSFIPLNKYETSHSCSYVVTIFIDKKNVVTISSSLHACEVLNFELFMLKISSTIFSNLLLFAIDSLVLMTLKCVYIF